LNDLHVLSLIYWFIHSKIDLIAICWIEANLMEEKERRNLFFLVNLELISYLCPDLDGA